MHLNLDLIRIRDFDLDLNWIFRYLNPDFFIDPGFSISGFPVINDPLYNHTVFGPTKGKGGIVGKTDAQLIQDLIAIHNAENWLGMDGDSELSMFNKDEGGSNSGGDPNSNSNGKGNNNKAASSPSSDGGDLIKTEIEVERSKTTPSPPNSETGSANSKIFGLTTWALFTFCFVYSASQWWKPEQKRVGCLNVAAGSKADRKFRGRQTQPPCFFGE